LSVPILKSQNDLKATTKTGVTLVVFTAPWCAPCQTQVPTIQQLAIYFEGEASIVEMNIDENPKTALELGIGAVPTLIIYSNGKEVQRFTGIHEEFALRDALHRTLGHSLDRRIQFNKIYHKELIMSEDKRQEATVESHKPARPMKFFKDKEGNGWLCDSNIDENGDLAAQGCWRCEDMAFPAGGR
jgi:thioredoxin